MPNQPQATMPRATAGIFAPIGPKDDRSSTGKGMPYFAPACPTSTIGISTMALATRIVSTACDQFIPAPIR
jgi:hypothetical protein